MLEKYLNGMSPMKQGQIKKALEKKYNFRLHGVLSVKEYIEKSYHTGNMEVEIIEQNKIKPMSRMQYFRADNKAQQAHEQKVKDAGKINTYWIDNYNFGKIAYDYAVYLLGMQEENIPDNCTIATDEDLSHLFHN